MTQISTNIWPNNPAEFEGAIDGLYVAMESMLVLAAASLYLGKSESWLPDMAHNGNTILRVIHYPALGENSQKMQSEVLNMKTST